MHIFIMRHGEAANIEAEDSLRPLTEQGIIETEKMGFWLARRKQTRLIKIFASPYLRAQQSCANVIATIQKTLLSNENTFANKKMISNEIIPETLDFITPSGNAHQAHDFIDGLFQNIDALNKVNSSDENEAILLVSHMPFVSYLVGELTGSLNMPIFSTGAVAIIDYDIEKMQGQLIDMVSPEKINI